jgi:hypothetical protein
MQQVEIMIEGGSPKVTVKCVKGQKCKDLTKEVVNLLGEVKESKATREMYERESQKVKAGH